MAIDTLAWPCFTEKLEEEHNLNEVSVVWNSALIERLQQEVKELVMQNTQRGEIATPIFTMMCKRDEQLASIILIKNRLAGISRDVIVIPPHIYQPC